MNLRSLLSPPPRLFVAAPLPPPYPPGDSPSPLPPPLPLYSRCAALILHRQRRTITILLSFVWSDLDRHGDPDGRVRAVPPRRGDDDGGAAHGRRLRRAGRGHRIRVRLRVHVAELGLLFLRPRRRRQLLLVLLQLRRPLRDVRPNDAAPHQEGIVHVLRRQVAVLRVAGGRGLPGGPGQAGQEAPQAVAELRGRPGRAPWQVPLAAPALPQGRRRKEGVREGRPLAARHLAQDGEADRQRPDPWLGVLAWIAQRVRGRLFLLPVYRLWGRCSVPLLVFVFFVEGDCIRNPRLI